VAIDYLETGKPIGIYASDIDQYTRGFMPGVVAQLGRIGQPLHSIDELASFIQTCPTVPTKRWARDLNDADSMNASFLILQKLGLMPRPMEEDSSPRPT
jgi:hypothetical protein